MKTMIVYASKSGAAKECAELLHQKIENSDLFDLSKETPSPEDYDTVIIGSGIRMGKLYKPARAFIKKNEASLLGRRAAYYLCGAYPDNLQKAIEKNIPHKLIEAAVCIKPFGGKPPYSSANSSEWLISANLTDFIKEVCI